jgi:hypothetical protein
VRAAVLTVSVEAGLVEAQLAAGVLACPCGGTLGPWGHARGRVVLDVEDEVRRLQPRRARCRACGATHVLLPAVVLLRRAHTAAVIGRALVLTAAGVAQRRVAARVGVARSTVRGWLARFTARAEALREHFGAWLLWLAPSRSRLDADQDGVVTGAVTAVVAAGREAHTVLGVQGLWTFASAATGGRLLCNTSAPFPAPWTG